MSIIYVVYCQEYTFRLTAEKNGKTAVLWEIQIRVTTKTAHSVAIPNVLPYVKNGYQLLRAARIISNLLIRKSTTEV